MAESATSGENPGWIFKHEADLDSTGVIKIRGGETIQITGEKQRYRRSLDDYTLDTRSWNWERTSKRNWRQFSIAQENGGLFILDRHPKPEALLRRDIGYVRSSCEEWNGARIIVGGVPVLVTVGVSFTTALLIPVLRRPAVASLCRSFFKS